MSPRSPSASEVRRCVLEIRISHPPSRTLSDFHSPPADHSHSRARSRSSPPAGSPKRFVAAAGEVLAPSPMRSPSSKPLKLLPRNMYACLCMDRFTILCTRSRVKVYMRPYVCHESVFKWTAAGGESRSSSYEMTLWGPRAQRTDGDRAHLSSPCQGCNHAKEAGRLTRVMATALGITEYILEIPQYRLRM